MVGVDAMRERAKQAPVINETFSVFLITRSSGRAQRRASWTIAVPDDEKNKLAEDDDDEKKWDDTPEDAERHDVTNDVSAYQLAEDQYPGKFGVFYEEDRPTKNILEQKWIDASQEKIGDAKAADLLRKRFAMMK